MSRIDANPPLETKSVTYRNEAALHHAEPAMIGAGWRICARREKEFRPFGWLIDPARKPAPTYYPPADPYTTSTRGCGTGAAELFYLLLLPPGLALNAIARRIWGRTRIEVLWERERW